jgi:alcohol dehydrogenase, propanol-preferring
MNAAQIVIPKESLQIQHLETPKPKGSQVLIKVNCCKKCRSKTI